MFSWFFRRGVDAFEQTYDYDMSHARELIEHYPKAFSSLWRAGKMGSIQDGVPNDAWYAAKIVAALQEDCGPCVQLVIKMAERAQVPAATLEALAAGRFADLPHNVALAARFAAATLNRAPEADPLRQQIVARFGKRGLISIAFAVTAARIYPTLKYALGYGHSCQRLLVHGRPVTRPAAAQPALPLTSALPGE